MIKAVPAPERVAMVKPVTANINPALAILAINIPARAPVTPEAPVRLAEENILNVIVNPPILGHQVLVLVPQLINTPARVLATPAAPALPATASTPPASVPQATNGKIALAK